MSKPDFSSYEQRWVFNEGQANEFSLITRKGPSGRGKHYVLDGKTRKYLTRGDATALRAQQVMRVIASQINDRLAQQTTE